MQQSLKKKTCRLSPGTTFFKLNFLSFVDLFNVKNEEDLNVQKKEKNNYKI